MFYESLAAVKEYFSYRNILFPTSGDRKTWEKVTPERRTFIIKEAEKYLGYVWPQTPASVYLEFTRNGNRSNYENIIFNGRREPLQYLVMAECLEGKKRFLDDIINGVWSTLDEASWNVPAHNNGNPLPDCNENVIIDLFSAECGGILAWALFELGAEFDKIAPQITARIRKELDRRIFDAFCENEYWWTGITAKRAPNNWNPWIISNILTALTFARPGREKADAVIEKCLVCLDNFVKFYAPDGGCDEGPCYWGAAAACLFDCIDVLYDLTGGKVDFFKEELVKNMCSYIYKMQISGHFFVCYADADAKTTPDPYLLYRMGLKTGDENFTGMASAFYRGNRKEYSICRMNGCSAMMYRRMKELFLDCSPLEAEMGFPYPADVWFGGIEVMNCRFEEGSDSGLFLSAKGGNNGESHNHNDIGSFVIYCGGEPAVIDIGRGEYVKQTFSDRRYEIPQMHSGYHNLPVIGGVTQHNGIEYKATDTKYSLLPDGALLEMNLKDAYPANANIRRWLRSFRFERDKNTVILTDRFSLDCEKAVDFIFMTPFSPEFSRGSATFGTGKNALTMTFDPSLTPSFETFDATSDSALRAAWGHDLYRVILKSESEAAEGEYVFVFTQK